MSGQPPQGPQAAAGQQQPQQQGHQLLKADDVLKLQSLSEDLKQKYRPIFHQLWNTVTTKPTGTPENTQARAKLQEFSQKLIAQERVGLPSISSCVPAPNRVLGDLDLPRPGKSNSRSAEPNSGRRAVATRPGRPAESTAEGRTKPDCPGSPAAAAVKPERDAAGPEPGPGTAARHRA
jgi:hypothetical protein